ncbi:hypothetical protein Tco_0305816, partial [Tanacetum coccineum]
HHQTEVPALWEWNHPTSDSQLEIARDLIQVIVNVISLVGVVFKHPLLKNFLHNNSGQIPEARSKWSLQWPIYCISDYLIHCLAHLVGNIEILQVA